MTASARVADDRALAGRALQRLLQRRPRRDAAAPWPSAARAACRGSRGDACRRPPTTRARFPQPRQGRAISSSATPAVRIRSSAKTLTEAAGTSSPSAEQNSRVQRCAVAVRQAGPAACRPRLNSSASRLAPRREDEAQHCSLPDRASPSARHRRRTIRHREARALPWRPSGSGRRRRPRARGAASPVPTVKPMRRWSAVLPVEPGDGIVLRIGVVVAALVRPNSSPAVSIGVPRDRNSVASSARTSPPGQVGSCALPSRLSSPLATLSFAA